MRPAARIDPGTARNVAGWLFAAWVILVTCSFLVVMLRPYF